MTNRKCQTLTFKQKMELRQYKDLHLDMKNKELARWASEHFGLRVIESTICRILKNKKSFLAVALPQNRKRNKECHVLEIEKQLYLWFVAIREQRICVSDDMLIMKAKAMHERLLQEKSLNDCQYSKGWLEGFKKRHGIKMRVLHGESGSVVLTEDVWDRFAQLKARIATYELKDVFNMDETGLFYKLKPNRTLANAHVPGEKSSKERIIVTLTCNMDGSVKLPPLVINRAMKPRAFSRRNIKNPANLGIQWFANKKVWMTGDIFEQFLLQFDLKMLSLGRTRVLLLLDNAPRHIWSHLQDRLKVTAVAFLPPLTTSRFQPLDAGIIRSFKMQYRKLLIQRQLDDFDAGQVTNIDVYDAVLMIEKSWTDVVTSQTIVNCWKHCGLVPYQDSRDDRMERDIDLNADCEDSDLAVQLQETEDLLTNLSVQYLVDMNCVDYLSFDSPLNAPTFQLVSLLEFDSPSPAPVREEEQQNEEEEEASATA
ncbi:hypothetical protein R1sor_019030 [Riccia sorocarpa]|uniref:HTH CENPB-type domain-containing protein n=1 Tax=Riccia sorocarpa TaxID=122646 RepID=A0ABD3IBF6_9MARC